MQLCSSPFFSSFLFPFTVLLLSVYRRWISLSIVVSGLGPAQNRMTLAIWMECTTICRWKFLKYTGNAIGVAKVSQSVGGRTGQTRKCVDDAKSASGDDRVKTCKTVIILSLLKMRIQQKEMYQKKLHRIMGWWNCTCSYTIWKCILRETHTFPFECSFIEEYETWATYHWFKTE